MAAAARQAVVRAAILPGVQGKNATAHAAGPNLAGRPELVNVQDVGGDAKPYQIRQVLRLVERYNLRLRDAP